MLKKPKYSTYCQREVFTHRVTLKAYEGLEWRSLLWKEEKELTIIGQNSAAGITLD
jgi:hypothetical protein